MIMEHTFAVDDPYKILASHIIAYYRPADVLRMMEDDNFLYIQIAKETRAQDMQGSFTDCIIEDILANKKRMEYMSHLDMLSDYYYSELDKERLRAEIRTALGKCGISLD